MKLFIKPVKRTCSLSRCISAVAAFSLPESLSSSSWFSANHCNFFLSADTSSLCLSSSTRTSNVLSPDTCTVKTHSLMHVCNNGLVKIGSVLYIFLMSKFLVTFTSIVLDPALPEVVMTWALAKSLSFFISCRSTSRACFSCFSL